jgi:iron complex transport system permease protein
MFRLKFRSGEKNSKSVRYSLFLSSIIIFIFVFVFSLAIGPVSISPYNILKTLGIQFDVYKGSVPYSDFIIISQLREPEIVGAAVVGASLGVGGAVIQSIFRNPISEPYITGISSGATLGAVISIVFGITFLGIFSVPILAFIFSLLTVFFVYMLSMRRGRTPPVIFLLTGIAISLFATSFVALLLYSKPTLENRIFFWILGSLSGISWTEDLIVMPVVVVTSLILGFMYRELNALQMGEAHAKSVGINAEGVKLEAITLTTISVSAAVSISGLIGFVGLIFPHVSRLLYGGSNKYVIPSSAILGATFLILSNDIAHSIIRGEVIPIGIVTGIIGVPFFMLLMMKMSSSGYYGS